MVADGIPRAATFCFTCAPLAAGAKYRSNLVLFGFDLWPTPGAMAFSRSERRIHFGSSWPLSRIGLAARRCTLVERLHRHRDATRRRVAAGCVFPAIQSTALAARRHTLATNLHANRC